MAFNDSDDEDDANEAGEEYRKDSRNFTDIN